MTSGFADDRRQALVESQRESDGRAALCALCASLAGMLILRELMAQAAKEKP